MKDETIEQAAMNAAIAMYCNKAFAILSQRDMDEAAEQHERLMQGWMNDLDQDDQATQEFCDAD